MDSVGRHKSVGSESNVDCKATSSISTRTADSEPVMKCEQFSSFMQTGVAHDCSVIDSTRSSFGSQGANKNLSTVSHIASGGGNFSVKRSEPEISHDSKNETVPCAIQFPQPTMPFQCRIPQFGSAKSPKSYWLRRHSDSLLVASTASSSLPPSSSMDQAGLLCRYSCSLAVDATSGRTGLENKEVDDKISDVDLNADNDEVFEDPVSMPSIVLVPQRDPHCFTPNCAAPGPVLPSSPILLNVAHRSECRKSSRSSVSGEDLPSIVEDNGEDDKSTGLQHFSSSKAGDGGKLLWHARQQQLLLIPNTVCDVSSCQESCASGDQVLNLSPLSRSPSSQRNFSYNQLETFPDCNPAAEVKMATHCSVSLPIAVRQLRTDAAGSRQSRQLSDSAESSPTSSSKVLLDDPYSADDSSSTTTSASSTPGKLHRCMVCRRSFSRSDMLERHVRLHTGVRPYACRLCSQVFSRSDHLTTHLRTHTGEKPYSCPRCSYSASRRDMVTRHLRVHMQENNEGKRMGFGSAPSSSSSQQLLAPNSSSVVVESSRCRGQSRNKSKYRYHHKVSSGSRASPPNVARTEPSPLRNGMSWMTNAEPTIVTGVEKMQGASVHIGSSGSSQPSDSIRNTNEREMAPGRRGLSLILTGHGSTGSTDSYNSSIGAGGDVHEIAGLSEGSPDVFRSPLSATRQAFKFMWPYNPSPLPATCSASTFFQH